MNKILLTFLALATILVISCAPIQDIEPIASETSDDSGSSESGIKTLADGTKYLIHPRNILSGGPPKDGIPSIDNPKFTSVADADWLDDENLVLGINYKGVQRAYPLRILDRHEIVNDKFGDEKILVTYCPLCRTGIAFKPIVDGIEVEFGTSGKLYNSELIMYDRKTDSYWAQSLGKAVIGDATGQVLEKVAVDTVMWKDWKKTYPNTQVLSRDTGFFSNYDRSPYPGYADSSRVWFPLANEDSRLFSKEIVFGVELNGKSKAYVEKDIKEERIVNDVVGGVNIIVMWDSSLNTVKIYERDEIEFSIDGNDYVDDTGKAWTREDFSDLEIVDTFGHFWFSWASFFPETELYGA